MIDRKNSSVYRFGYRMSTSPELLERSSKHFASDLPKQGAGGYFLNRVRQTPPHCRQPAISASSPPSTTAGVGIGRRIGKVRPMLNRADPIPDPFRKPPASPRDPTMTPDLPTPANLLADLESRQDELLRLLGELEERTKQALANLTAPAQGDGGATGAKPTHDSNSTPPIIVAASDAIQSGIEPSMRIAADDEKKPSRTSVRSRKAA
jgi:hypothetical protein